MIIKDNSVYEIKKNNNGHRSAKLIRYDIGAHNNIKTVNIESVSIPDDTDPNNEYDIEEIGEYAFANCLNIENVTMPKVRIIGEGAFLNCINLKTITIPKDLMIINSKTFKNCKSLEKVFLINNCSLKTIGESAFENCTSLSFVGRKYNQKGEVNLPKTVISIEKRAFSDCCNITDISFLNSASNTNISIEKEAFINCKRLKTISGFSKVTVANEGVFENCKKLNNIDTSKLTVIKDRSFKNCQRLRNAGLNLNSVIEYSQTAFEGCSNFNFNNSVNDADSTIQYCFPQSFIIDDYKKIEFNILLSSKDLEQRSKKLEIATNAFFISITAIAIISISALKNYSIFLWLLSIFLVILGLGFIIFNKLSVNYKTLFANNIDFYTALGLSFFSAGALLIIYLLYPCVSLPDFIFNWLGFSFILLYICSNMIIICIGIRTIYSMIKHYNIIDKIKRITIISIIISILTALVFIADVIALKEFIK